MNKILAIFLIALLFVSCKPSNSSNLDNSDFKNTSVSLFTLMDSLNLKKKDLSIYIDKSDYKLSILHNLTVIKDYPVVLGTNPIDDKLMEGDRSTPEGKFKIRDYYPHKSWSKFIWIDYPTQDSWRKHNQAKSENRIPIDATIGGEIGIHGVPEGKSDLIANQINWTWGCISLTNRDVDEIYEVVYKGMKVEIVK